MTLQDNIKRYFILILSLILYASYVPASGFDVSDLSSKEIKKAESKAEDFAVKLDQADVYFSNSQVKKAAKRLTQAEKSFNKIPLSYQKHPGLVSNKKRFDELKSAIEHALQRAELTKNLASYEKKIKEAEKFFSQRNNKNCNRRLNSADKIYQNFPTSYQSNENVQSLHSKYLQVLEGCGGETKISNTKVAKSAAGDQVENTETYGLSKKELKKAKRYATRFDKKLAEAQRFYDEKAFRISEKRLIDAGKLYPKIGAYQKHSSVIELKAKFDALNSEVTQIVAEEKQRIADINETSLISSAFNSNVRDNIDILEILAQGKLGKKLTSLPMLDRFQAQYMRLDKFNTLCEGEYASFIERNPDTVFEGYSVSEIVDLAKNRAKYRKDVLQPAALQELDDLINALRSNNSEILSSNIIATSDLAHLRANNYPEEFYSVTRIKEMFKWANIKEPNDKWETINSLQEEQIQSINKAKSNLSFDKSDYPISTDAMKRAARETAKSWKMKLIYVGMKDQTWRVSKNDFGIPLYKVAIGRALYQVEGDDFYIGYDVRITRQYNGAGYEPTSSVRPDSKITIYGNY